MRLTNAHIFDVNKGFIDKDLYIDGEIISSENNDKPIDLSNCYIIPGLTDLHSHGCSSADFSDGDIDGLKKMCEYQLSRGITQYCPTGMTLDVDALKQICRMAAQYKKSNTKGANLVGIQLEGPFFCEAKKGAQNAKWLRAPDKQLFEELQEEAEGLVKIIALAPELEGAMDFIKTYSNDVVISLGHTTANYDTALKALNNGAKQITHLLNAMNPFSHREPGPMGAAADSDCQVELICDGVHIHPAMVRSVFKIFGASRVTLISDSMRAAGMPDGDYTLGGQKVIVKGNLATLEDGTIAGSVTDLMKCMVTAVSFGIPLYDAVISAAVNPAKTLGIYDEVGSLCEGKLANIAILNADYSLKAVIMRGEVVVGEL